MIGLGDMQRASVTIHMTGEGNVAWGRVISSKINHRHASTPFASYFAGVIQDKGLPNFVAGICTTLLTPPVMCWHNMYFFYIFF